MTATVTKHTARRALTLGGAVGTATLLLAGPASAEVPVGWEDPGPVDKFHVLGYLVGGPILLFVLISLAVYLPSLIRGERVAPGATGPEDLWLGGRRSAGELTPAGSAAPAADEPEDGGASARW